MRSYFSASVPKVNGPIEAQVNEEKLADAWLEIGEKE